MSQWTQEELDQINGDEWFHLSAATGAAMYTAANAGTKQFTAKGFASATGMGALGGAAGGVGGKLLGAVANRTGGVYIARQGARAYVGQSGNIGKRMTQLLQGRNYLPTPLRILGESLS